MLRKQLTVLGTGCFLAMSVHSALALSNPDRSLLTLDSSSPQTVSSRTSYIVQLRGTPAAVQHNNSIAPKAGGVLTNVKYNPNSPQSLAHRQELANQQNRVMASVGVNEATYTYEHSFNGFSATLTTAQVNKLKNDPDVLNVWPNELLQLDTANTPAFLGLTSPGGLHDLGTKGEDVIIGIVDSGVWPENPSLVDDAPGNEFAPIAATRPDWAGDCETGTDPDFSCNNKLIGARYYNAGFGPENILPGEFDSPRDADGHGTHTMTTAGGNENTEATLQGVPVGTVSGMAPRARVAAYKVCWNGSTPGNSGCFTNDSVAAIDAATADGVDVINFSISGSRTAQTDPVHVAFFNAARGGVYSSLSAGNSGPGAQTVAHNVPWVTTVGASTYNGDAALVGNELEVSYDAVSQDPIFSVVGGDGIPAEGLTGELAPTLPANACSALTNPGDLAGKVALIARGQCNFTDKQDQALAAGAVGVVMYTDNRTPTTLPGGYPFASVMIENSVGLDLVNEIQNNGVTVSIDLTETLVAKGFPQPGNQMAGFSSRGESQATGDVIKPDITAPGVTILAGTSADQIDGGEGENYGFLSGTSMSSPHIAGIAALVRETHPTWTPSAVKSAIMTTARQDVTKEDGATPADPFDFGAGHVVPNSAVTPGIVYDASFNDYFAYLCGQGEQAFVDNNYFPGACGALEGAGFPSEASDLNIASIAIAELSEAQTVRRFVTNVTGNPAATFTASVEAPAGVDVAVSVYDFGSGSFVNSDTMAFNADGLGIYELTFTPSQTAVLDAWEFGSVTWSDGVHSARSPIAMKPVLPPRIVAPDAVDLVVNGSAGRLTLPVEIAYNGRFFTQAIGLDAPAQQFALVGQDPDSNFSFNEAGLGFYFVDVPAGTRIAKFGLSGADQAEGVDLDLYVYACPNFQCSQVGTSLNGGSEESVLLVDPQPLANLGNRDIYVVFVHGYDLDGQESVVAPLNVWTVDESRSTNMSARASSLAVDGRTNRVYVGMRGLQSGGDYVGGIIYKDENGDENGMTVMEVKAQ